MLKPHQIELLQRYHDGEANVTEKVEVEELLARDPDALAVLGRMDEVSELFQESDALDMARVSFDGFWGKVQTGIEAAAAADAAAAAATRKAAEPAAGGLIQWLKELIGGHKGAWITATATAAAVALVLVVVNQSTPETQVKTVVEKHYIYVDSVNKADPQSTVVINSLQDEGSAVIWLLPNAGEGAEEQGSDPGAQDDEGADSEDVIIETEPL